MKPLVVRLLAFLVIFAVGVAIAFWMITRPEPLRVWHPSQLDARLVDPAVRNQPGEHRISDFDLMDQRGEHLTLADVQGNVLLVDFFFTTCQSICPKMTTQMERVQAAYKDDDRVMLLSHSVTPELDSTEVLAAYADLHGADHRRWRFLTGDRARIYALARRSYFAALDEGDGGPDDFVHTENFVLVDQLGRIRGFYDGTKAAAVDKAIDDIARLLDGE